MDRVFQARILKKYDVDYFRCPNCRLIQPESPYWLEEAYSNAIAQTDVGLVSRNRSNWFKLRPILQQFSRPGTKILDVGGGYGLLCRGLRDDGFDCYTTDAFCDNLFAAAFEPDEGFQAEILLAFEVLEHLTDPLEFLRTQFDRYGANTLIFSTLVHSGDTPPPMDWWYYAFETGQHTALYHEKTLATIAKELGLFFYSAGPDFHIFTRSEIGMAERLLTLNKYVSMVYGVWLVRARRKQSLLQQDYQEAKRRLL